MMAYHERDVAELIDALSQRYRDGEFTSEVYLASLIQFMPRDEAIAMVRQQETIRHQFLGSDVRLRSQQTADDIAAVINSMLPKHPAVSGYWPPFPKR